MELTGKRNDYLHEGKEWADWRSGHSGEVFAARFDPTGQHIASGSMDRDICRQCMVPDSRGYTNGMTQYYGGHRAIVGTTVCYPVTRALSSIYNGLVTLASFTLLLQTCTS